MSQENKCKIENDFIKITKLGIHIHMYLIFIQMYHHCFVVYLQQIQSSCTSCICYIHELLSFWFYSPNDFMVSSLS